MPGRLVRWAWVGVVRGDRKCGSCSVSSRQQQKRGSVDQSGHLGAISVKPPLRERRVGATAQPVVVDAHVAAGNARSVSGGPTGRHYRRSAPNPRSRQRRRRARSPWRITRRPLSSLRDGCLTSSSRRRPGGQDGLWATSTDRSPAVGRALMWSNSHSVSMSLSSSTDQHLPAVASFKNTEYSAAPSGPVLVGLM